MDLLDHEKNIIDHMREKSKEVLDKHKNNHNLNEDLDIVPTKEKSSTRNNTTS